MFNLPQLEKKILKFWQDQDVFKKSLDKKSPKGDFVFYEGPPTANGKPGIHHVLARAFKDAIPRYKTMQGFHVERKAGWDTHGLPVELEVEKKLKLKDKKDVEEYGIEKFNKECKESVWQYKEDWEKLTERMGFWIDMDHPYVTYENDYIESLWWIIKEAHEKKLLYKGYKVIPNCPRCGTALSSHEVAQGYKNVEEESVFLKFKIKGKENEHILAWTTTPWTLPGNVALAVGEKINYSVVEKDGDTLILAEDLVEKVLGEVKVVKTVKGKELVGLEYEPLFSGAIPKNVENFKNAFKVYAADFVSTEDGTGVVHTAVMYGQEDYELGEKVKLPKVHTVSLEGTFNELVPQWQGKFVKDVEKEIITDLKKRGLLLKTEMYAHDYPFCWRCDTPLIYYAKDSWYFKMSVLRDKLLKNNDQINWVPEHIKEGRFGEWLREVKDWAISRERYWGTPIPIWQCQIGKKQETRNKKQGENGGCGNMIVIGSVDELKRLSGKNLDDLHRPYIDEVTFKCSECGGEMYRIPEVMDCWFDSGSMPFAQHHYPFENKKDLPYPAEYISEAIDQTRGWFYTLLAVGTILDQGPSYENVICLGHILDKKGKKMSKSKGNVVGPWQMFEKYGADATRWYLYTINSPGEPKMFDEAGVKDSGRMFITLFNVLSFYKMFVSKKLEIEKLEIRDLKNVLDRWIAAKLNLLIQEVTGSLDKYDLMTAARKIEEFINDLSTWYVRRSRERFKGSAFAKATADKEDEEDKAVAIYTLGKVLFELTKLLAPFAPFTAEHVYQELGKECGCLKESVHLEDWPEVEKKYMNQKIIDYMEMTRKVVELGLAKRAEEGIKVRQPLNKLKIHPPAGEAGNSKFKINEEYINLIKEEVNVKNVEFTEGDGEVSVELDTKLTPELKEEGLLRELVRTINGMRKKAGLTLSDRVKIEYKLADEELKSVLSKYSSELKKSTLADEIMESGGKIEEVKINDIEVGLKITKL